MKKLLLLITSICFITLLQAQVYKTIDVATAGTLSTLLTKQEDTTVTNLTVTGTINEPDFEILNKMTKLVNLNLTNVNIESYTYTPGNIAPANEIPSQAFHSNVTLDTIYLPNSDTSIGDAAFLGCNSLKSITFQSSVTAIGFDAFSECTNLMSITIPSSVSTIGAYAFSKCINLKSIILPSSLTSIEFNTFSYCTSLNSISIPSSITKIESQSFINCRNLISITIPASVSIIEDNAFDYCNIITVENSNPNYASIDGVLFNKDLTTLIHCPISKTGVYNIPSTVTTITNGAFAGCSSLISIIIPSSVLNIGDNAFMGCSGLTSIIIPTSVINIGYSAFSGCTNLTTVSLSNSITKILSKTFSYCSGLTSITIPLSVTDIGEHTFLDCSSLKNITIPSSIVTLKDSVFYNCTSLKSVTIQSSLTSIGNGAFGHCDSLRSIIIPSTVSTIGYAAFEYCKSLQTIYSENKTAIPIYYSPRGYVSVQDPVFYNIDTNSCILYVPFGSKSAYQSAYGWKSFQHIVELGTIDLSTTSVSISKSEGSYATVTITDTVTWIASSNQSWLTVSPVIATQGNGTLTLTANANPTNFTRSATVLVQANGAFNTVKVSQAPNDTILSLSKARLAFIDSSSTKKVFISTNVPWSASTDVKWLTISPVKDSVSDSLIITTQTNTTTAIRTALVIIAAGSKLDTIVLSQAPGDTALTFSTATLSFTDSLSTNKVFISTNAPWSASADVAWLTISPAAGIGSDSITITAQANTTAIARTGTITVTSKDSVKLKAMVEHTITITQAAKLGMVVIDVRNETNTLYPNPAHKSFNISNEGEATVEMYNLNTQLVLQRKIVGNEPIPLNNITTGVYFVKVITGNDVVTKRLVVQ